MRTCGESLYYPIIQFWLTLNIKRWLTLNSQPCLDGGFYRYFSSLPGYFVVLLTFRTDKKYD